MKLIIEISDASYETVKNGTWCGSLYEELKNGTPLSESDDCVSRQAVLEKAICVPIARVVTEDKVIYRKIVFVDEIENIPPVMPAEKVGEWIEEVHSMTIEESIQVLCANVMVAVDRAEMSEACSKMVEDALNMAIASLEAWERVKAEIDEQYDRVHPYNISCAEGLEMALEIIDKHLQKISETETWSGFHGQQIIAPKGTFDKIYNAPDEEDDDI